MCISRGRKVRGATLHGVMVVDVSGVRGSGVSSPGPCVSPGVQPVRGVTRRTDPELPTRVRPSLPLSLSDIKCGTGDVSVCVCVCLRAGVCVCATVWLSIFGRVRLWCEWGVCAFLCVTG